MSGLDDVLWIIDRLREVDDDDTKMMLLRRWRRSRERSPKPRAEMETFNFGPRKSLTELRPRHLLMVEEYGFGPDYDRGELRDYFLKDYYRLFGPLRRSKAHEVPSDLLKKELMIEQLLELIEGRRAEYAEERSRQLPRQPTNNIRRGKS